MIAFIIFSIISLCLQGQIITPTTATCQSSATLALFGFTSQSASIINNGTCRNYYASVGACANVGQVLNTLNSNNKWLLQKSLDAVSFASQFINATIYFQTINGFINANTVVPISTSFWNQISTFFKNLANRTVSLFSTAFSWIQNLFNSTSSAINPCFQVLANLTNGAYCVVSSSSAVPYTLNTNNPSVPFSLVVDPTTTGQALAQCAPLIDTYCSLTYGISISNSNLPFNNTFNWSDGGISQSTCLAFKANFNGTTNLAALNILYVSLFRTNQILFVPSTASITNLGNFLTASTQQAVTSYTPVQQTANGVGISLIASGLTNAENLYLDGQNSGQPGMMYGSAMTLFINIIIALLTLII